MVQDEKEREEMRVRRVRDGWEKSTSGMAAGALLEPQALVKFIVEAAGACAQSLDENKLLRQQ